MPFALPDWAPWWLELIVLVVVALVALMFLAMPFSVFGLKARLDMLDERLDDLQADLRALTIRLPDPEMRDPAAWRRSASPDDRGYVAPVRQEAPVPPAPVVPQREHPLDYGRDHGRDPGREPRRDPGRTEPQLRWRP